MQNDNQPAPGAACQVCGHPYRDHRGKKGCMRPLAKMTCPCARFAPEGDHLPDATRHLWGALKRNGHLEPAAADKEGF